MLAEAETSNYLSQFQGGRGVGIRKLQNEQEMCGQNSLLYLNVVEGLLKSKQLRQGKRG